jgi:hypothetical protein
MMDVLLKSIILQFLWKKKSTVFKTYPANVENMVSS